MYNAEACDIVLDNNDVIVIKNANNNYTIMLVWNNALICYTSLHCIRIFIVR